MRTAKRKTGKKRKTKKKRTPRKLGPIESRIKAGKTVQKIMKELKIKSKATLHKQYLDELAGAGKVKPLLTAARGRPAKALRDTAKVGKRGTLTVPSELIGHFGFKAGDSFKISKRSGRIILAKV